MCVCVRERERVRGAQMCVCERERERVRGAQADRSVLQIHIDMSALCVSVKFLCASGVEVLVQDGACVGEKERHEAVQVERKRES